MVEPATSLGRSGLQDWLIQRCTAVILAISMIWLLGYLILHPGFNYDEWRSLFYFRVTRYGSLLVLLSLLAHAWIGIWTVTTDYIRPLLLRLLMQFVVFLALFVFFLWGVQIIWGV